MNRPFLRQYITVNILIILVSELNEDRLIELSYRYLLLGSLSNDDGDGNENSKKSNRFRLAKQQLCTCITLLCTFLCRHCTTTTRKGQISRFVKDGNTREQLSLSFAEL